MRHLENPALMITRHPICVDIVFILQRCPLSLKTGAIAFSDYICSNLITEVLFKFANLLGIKLLVVFIAQFSDLLKREI